MLQQWLFAWLLVMTRIIGLLLYAPVLGGRQVPRLVKVGLVLALSVFWFDPSAGAPLPASGTAAGVQIVLWTGRELLFGAGLGFVLSLALVPARIAGAYLGHEAGLSMASVVDPNSGSSGNVLAELLDVLSIMAFFAVNGHHAVLALLDVSLRAFPAGAPTPRLSAEFLAGRVSAAHQMGMLAVLPAAACMFVVMCGLLILMRSAPQFSLFSIGQSLRVAVGLVATVCFLPGTVAVLLRIMADLRTSLSAGWPAP